MAVTTQVHICESMKEMIVTRVSCYSNRHPLSSFSFFESLNLKLLTVSLENITIGAHTRNLFLVSFISGPWIENLFIKDFIGKPFTYFQGVIPLFVQWSDYHLHMKRIINPATTKPFTEEEIFLSVSKILRKNVLYMIVSQANYGINFLMTKHPNVLVFSAGGEGDIPIPLIKGELPYSPVETLTAQ